MTTTYLKTQLNEHDEPVPADNEALPQHTEDCFSCGGDGYLVAGARENGEYLLLPCDVHAFQPDRDAMDAEHHGVLVAWSQDVHGSDHLIALTGDTNAARAALEEYCRDILPGHALAYPLTTEWVVFTRHGAATADLQAYKWQYAPATAGTTDAVEITRALTTLSDPAVDRLRTGQGAT
ncbi:hypothetical protein HUT19_42125 (plasmid) [Streptomyces sp. NA02950]|uniref:hypothetical protein n=1 Tax=Streptomyces sp. NA02950 TaxID=2742137 RepID=UPI001590099D|nr:hypothetical protein [Streptomyces sp. NA02950]QKV98316.1 hypothetical protein HUT19_42125 [Streptomyces sp. NA02950]